MANRTVTLSDLTQDLLWPRLLRTPSLALAPGRLVLSLLAVVLIALAMKIPNLWMSTDWQATATSVTTATTPSPAPGANLMAPQAFLDAAWSRWFEAPVALVSQHPWATMASLLPAVLVIGVLGGAVSRSASVETASGIRPSMTSSLGFALSKWRSLGAALLGPPLIVLLIVGLLAATGWVLFSLAGIKLLGALLYPLLLLGGLMVVLLVMGYALGWPMLAPAVMSEGSDGLDSLQRVYAYVIARPLRLVVYLLILLVLLGFSAGVFDFVMTKMVTVTARSASAWLSSGAAQVLTENTPLRGSFSDRGAGWLVGFWVTIVKVVTAAYVFSFIASGGSVLYLLMRRVCDGQDVGEVWMPEAPRTPLWAGAEASQVRT